MIYEYSSILDVDIGYVEHLNANEIERHEVRYIDDNIIITSFEYCFAVWYTPTGLIIGGSLWGKEETITTTSLDDVHKYIISVNQSFNDLKDNFTINSKLMTSIFQTAKNMQDKYNKYAIFIALAKNENTQSEILNELSENTDDTIRCNLARNLNLPIKTLRKLFKDDNSHVRRAVLKNPNFKLGFLV